MIFVSRNGEKFDKCENVEFEDEEKFRRLLLRLIKEERDLLLPPVIEEKRPSIILLAEEFQVSSGLIDLPKEWESLWKLIPVGGSGKNRISEQVFRETL